MNDLSLWGPILVLGIASFVTGQRARECRTPEGIARERAALRTIEGWTRRYRPQGRDFTPEGRRFFHATLVLQGMLTVYVVAFVVVRVIR
jgi:hypothetical protein